MDILNVNNVGFKNEIENYNGTVLIDFFSPKCAPCRRMEPVIKSVALDAGESVKVCRVNVETEGELVKKFGIMSIPTLVVMKNGEIKNRSIGVTGKKAVMDMLNF